jgi:hypothetical protein
MALPPMAKSFALMAARTSVTSGDGCAATCAPPAMAESAMRKAIKRCMLAV